MWVRINSGEIGRADATVLGTEAAGLSGVVLAKCDEPDWLDEIAAMIPTPIPLSPLIESALGLRRLDALCAHPRVSHVPPGRDRPARRVGRTRRRRTPAAGPRGAALLFASAAARILPPIGGVYAALRDLEGLAADSARLAELGFAGRPASTPRRCR